MQKISLFLFSLCVIAVAERSGDEFTFDMLRGNRWNTDRTIALKAAIAQGEIMVIDTTKGKYGTAETRPIKDYLPTLTFNLSKVIQGPGAEVNDKIVFDSANELSLHVTFKAKTEERRIDPVRFFQNFKFLGSVSNFATITFSYLTPDVDKQFKWTSSPAKDEGLTFTNDKNAKGLLELPATKGLLQLSGRNIKTLRVQYAKLPGQDAPPTFELKAPFTIQ